MISREEAKAFILAKSTKCKNKHDTLSWSLEIIEDIYDSIGSCGECEYGSADRIDTTLCCNKDSCLFGEIHENSWFCADFKRKD